MHCTGNATSASTVAHCLHLLPVSSLVACSRACRQWRQVVLPRINLMRLQKFGEALSPNFLNVSHVLDEIASALKNSKNLAVSYARAWERMAGISLNDDERINQLVQKYRFNSLKECASLKQELKFLQAPSSSKSQDYKKISVNRHDVLLKLVKLYLAEGAREQAQKIVRECASLRHEYRVGPGGTEEEITGENKSNKEYGPNTFIITCSAGWVVSPAEERDGESEGIATDDEDRVEVSEDGESEGDDLIGLANLNLEEGSKEQVQCIVRQGIFAENTIAEAASIILKDFISHDKLDEGFEFIMAFPDRNPHCWISVEKELFERLVKANKIETALAMVKKDLPYETDYIGLEKSYFYQLDCLFENVHNSQLIDKIFQVFNKVEGYFSYRDELYCHFASLLVKKEKGDLAYQVLKKIDEYRRHEEFTEVLKKWVDLEVAKGHFVKVIAGIVGIQTFFLRRDLNPVLKNVLSKIPIGLLSLEQINEISDHLCRWDDMLQEPQVHWANLLIDHGFYLSASKMLNNRPNAVWEDHRKAMQRLRGFRFSE